MKIKYFAWLKDITNTDSEEITDNTIIDIETLKNFLCNKYPKLEKFILKENIIRIAVNFEYMSDNAKIKDHDEIALFPPVSGG